ncbi:MAG: carboxypeptidase regulatory-like domain-containing protein [Sphingobacteriales bacterium]|nr:carboxypeptidase regulatory-like domain-containing protein [Sphingobacteriales bacterium]
MKRILCNIRSSSDSFGKNFKKIFVIAFALVISIHSFAYPGGGSPGNSDFTCNAHITSLYFNKLDGGADIPITNGATFTSAQLGSLYNLEAGTSGTVGSVKFTITGPSASNNIENSAPYNSPATGSGPWTGSPGNYSVNIKAYSLSNAGGSICHDTTITFILTNDCSCPNNLLTNGSFENSASGWTVSGGSLTFGTGYVMCGSYNGFLNWSSGTAKVWQEVAVSAGSVVDFKGYAGTHNPGLACSPQLSLIFYNSSNTVISQSDAAVTFDVGSGNQLALYTINATAPAGTVKVRVQGSITCNTLKVDGFCLTVTPVTSPLTLGNKVFYDFNRSGMFDAGDGFVAGATVKLYLDANNDNIPDGAFIQSMATNALGEYSFTNLAAGNYIVGVAIPATYAITVINGGDPDNNIDDDNNATTVVSGEARGMSITLASGTEPTGGNTNNTYDFGFYNPIAPPNGGQSCFSGTNPIVYAKSYWNVNANSQTVTIRVTFSKAFVDNTYGTGAIGWPSGHTFGNLTGSDHLQWSLKNGNGTEVLKFKQDYISANGSGYNYPSGYGTLGFSGDGGTPNPGLATDVLSFRTSLSTNFNDYGYVLTTNSPATNATYTPNPAQPNWIFDVWYEVTVKASVFGASGFGFVDVASVHASPSKTGNNTEIITHNPCAAGSISDYVWNDIDKDGIQDATEVGIAGVVVTLYDSTSNTVLASTITDGYGNYKFSNLETNTAGKKYQVRFSLVPGYQFSPNSGAVTVTNNSDANLTTGRTGTITLTDAVPNVTYVDAGMYYSVPARIGDYVWNDLNKNGIQEAGEPGIAGVTVMLYTTADVLYRSTITSNNGYYFFDDVAPGSYYVKVSPPPGYQVSPKDATADNLDSDIDPVTRKTGTITVVAGTNNLTIDAGLNVTSTTGPSASLGDRVWEDLNNNGLQDAGEPGVANVTVQLYNSSNVLQATLTTDAFGNYMFNGLTPGSYYVKFTAPAGFTLSTANVGADDAVDSDVDGTNGAGTTVTVTLVDDQINTTLDAGLVRSVAAASLGDYVWYDLNKNGIQDGGSEVGVPGITVLLYNSSNVVVQTTTTNSNGFYLFTGLTAATNYTVGFANIPSGYGFSLQSGAVSVANNSDVNPATGRTGVATTGAAGTTITYVDAGLIITPNTFDSKATLGDRVWNDLNNNGIQDAGEPGIPGVTVTLYAANGTTVLATTTTDALGNYLFTNLDAGSYVVGFSGLPAGYVFATKDAGADDAKDSDADAATGKTAPITLAPGEINLTIDAGARNTASLSALGNFVWYDVNNNGIQDAGEQGAAGISVRLTDMAGNIVKTTTTNVAGEYLFTDLAAGNYFIDFANLPAGYSIGTKNAAGSTSANNSDANIGTSKTDVIILPASTTDLTWDMGIVTTTRASLGDFVWNDVNMNGRQDAGETGVAGVLVTLYNSSNVAVASTVTDANGFYLFSNLLPGTYSVGFSNIPASSSFTIQNAGVATAATNSDPDPTTGRTATFSLAAGQAKTDIDAGLVSLLAAVGDYVWNDLNRNGIQDAGEPPVAGVTVTLYNSANVAVASAVTDAKGYYLINNIPVPIGGANFTIGFTDTPTGMVITTKNAVGSTPDNDSNADPVTGLTDPFALNPGQIRLDIDAGLYKLINLSGNVWHDVNAMTDNMVNNTGPLQTPPAVPIPANIIAYLVNSSGIVEKITPVNPANGQYSFTNVTPNTTYYVLISTTFGVLNVPPPPSTLPSGWLHTGQQLGSPVVPGHDGLNDGRLIAPVGTSDVINVNFGIRKTGGDVVIG